MKSRFVYINTAEVTQDLKVYSVYIGTSRRARLLIDRVTLLSRRSPNVYFAKYSHDVCDFLCNLAVQLHGGADNPLNAFYELNHKWINVKEFREILPPFLPEQRKNPKSKHYEQRQ